MSAEHWSRVKSILLLVGVHVEKHSYVSLANRSHEYHNVHLNFQRCCSTIYIHTPNFRPNSQQTIFFLTNCSTSFTTAAYGSHQNVFIRLDPLGRPPSVNSGSYATIASLNKYPLSEYKKSCKLPSSLFCFSFILTKLVLCYSATHIYYIAAPPVPVK